MPKNQCSGQQEGAAGAAPSSSAIVGQPVGPPTASREETPKIYCTGASRDNGRARVIGGQLLRFFRGFAGVAKRIRQPYHESRCPDAEDMIWP
jgi:hypothetical protein